MGAEPVEFEEAGHQLKLWLTTVGKRSDTVILSEEEMSHLAAGQLIAVEDLPLPEYPAKPPAAPPDEEVKEGDQPSPEHVAAVTAYTEAMAEYADKKASWEAIEATKPRQKNVTLWVPVNIVGRSEIDGNQVKIFHTLRGPVMGMVLTEDLHRATVYSPCLIDPNVQAGRIHFFPIAFAGFNFIVYKSGMGESIPQEAEMRGYAHYLNRNRAGDYRFRMRSAYHHIDASMPDDAQVINAPAGVREHLFGLVPTSNTEEEKQIAKIRQMQRQLEATRSEPPEGAEAQGGVSGVGDANS